MRGIGKAPELRLKLHSDRFQSPLRHINPLWLLSSYGFSGQPYLHGIVPQPDRKGSDLDHFDSTALARVELWMVYDQQKVSDSIIVGSS